MSGARSSPSRHGAATQPPVADRHQRSPPRHGFLPVRFALHFGTEPFGSADIIGGKLNCTTPDSLDSGGSPISMTRADRAGSMRFTAVLDGQGPESLLIAGGGSQRWHVRGTLSVHE